MAQSDSDDFELVDSIDVARSILAEKKPDLTKVRAWLAPTNYTASSSEYHRHLSSQALGTGEWIRETSQFEQWHTSSEHGSIWIKAVPGAGKSVVAASMVDSLAQQESVPVLYFFFRQIIETNRTSRALLRDWLAQLLPTSEVLQVSLWDLVEDKRVLESISTEQLWKLLHSALRSVDKAYVIVDALDEMDLDEDFLARLNAMGSFRPGHVKVLMTSRPKQYLQRAMKDPQVIHVSLEEELVKRDISVFVAQRVSKLRNMSIESQQLIHAVVCARSQGLFLYARLMLDSIAKSMEMYDHDVGSIRHMVTLLPHGLQRMYNQTLFEHAAISDVGQDIQVLILQLVTQSARPMRLIEIAKAIEVIHPDLPQDSKDIIRTACGPLLEIMEDEVVQILHHSFTEFLLDRGRCDTEPAPQFPVIDPLIAHRSIATMCLSLLQGDAFTKFKPDGADDNEDDLYGQFSRRSSFDFRSAFLQYPLVEYAANKWAYHAKHYDVRDAAFFMELERFCDLKKSSFNAWLQLASQDGEGVIAKEATPLHVAAALGLESWSEHLINKARVNVDSLDQTKNTPLFWAARSGHACVVRLLIKAGTELDLDGYDGLKPLHAAASRNHAEVVKLLVAAGVSPITPKTRDIGRRCGNAPTSVGHSPLRYASQAGHVESVVAMLPYVMQAEDLEDSLSWAAEGGHSMLLAAIFDNSNVSPDGRLKIRHESISVTTGGQTPLILAAKALDPKCVRILLDKGADARKSSSRDPDEHYYGTYGVRRQGRNPGVTALHSLVRSNINKESEGPARQIFKMLRAAGADLEARDHYGNTPLLSTIGDSWSYGRDILISVNMLLDAGADPFATDNNGDSLLHKACQTSSSTDITRRLLELKVSPSQHRISDGATPLIVAMANIHCPAEMTKLLVNDHGADVDAVDADGNTALIRVCKESSGKHKEAIAALLECGAKVNIQNKAGETCLHLFWLRTQSYDNNENVLQDILKVGADLELRDREGKTVLLYAVEKSNEALVKVLLQSSHPSIAARTFRHGKSALHLACHARDPLEMIETLVDQGADPQWTDNDGNTLLHEVAARFESYSEDVALVERLLELGVPANAQNCLRRTALAVMPDIKSSNSSREKPSRETMASILLRLAPNLDVNAADIDGFTPLHLAAAASEAHTYKLLQAGARVDAKSFDLQTPLHCAARARQSGIVSMLIKHSTERTSLGQWPGINAIDRHGRSPLHDACRSGRPESVRILLDAGADVHEEGGKYCTPLRVCAEFAEEDKLWSCLRNGTAKDEFRPNIIANNNNYGPPNDALQHDTARIGPIVAMLIDAGATDKEFHTLFPARSALQEAVQARCVDMVGLLRGQFPDSKASFDEVQLMFAARNAAKVLDEWKSNGPEGCSPEFITKIDDATMHILIARGVTFTKATGGHRGYRTAISAMAGLGLTEKMRKVVHSAKLLDETKDAADEENLRPVLLDACDRPLWNMDMLRILVNKGLVDVNAHQQIKEKVNYRDTGNSIPGSTALHVLAKGNYWWHIEAIKFLVDNGAEVDCLDENGQTPLEIASTCVRYGSAITQAFFKPQCCDILLKLGANPNRLNKEGLVPLNFARSDEDIIKVLIRGGADVNGGTKGVLMSAVEAGDVDTLKTYLLAGADCNVPDLSSDSSHESRSHNQASKKYPLLKAALPPSYGGWDKGTSRKMLDLLLDHGAKVDLAISDDETLIHYNFSHASTSTLRAFIDRPGLDFNIKDQKGRTVFLAACESHIDHESNGSSYVHYQERDRLRAEYTPAYLALADSQLYGNHIDYLATDVEGRHIINYLLPKWTDRIADRFLSIPGVRDLICQKDKKGFSPLQHALKALKVTAALRFIDEGNADLLEPDPNGDTAAHHLYRCHWVSQLPKYQPLIDRYLQLGGDMNAPNKVGETPLHAFLASSNESSRWAGEPDDDEFDSFDFLIEKGTDFKAIKNDRQTALHVVAQRAAGGSISTDSDEGSYNARLFRKLVDLGCDPLQEDKDGRTALDIAAAIGNESILKLYQRKKT